MCIRDSFVYSTETDGSRILISAASGRVESINQQQWLQVNHGQRLLFDRPGQPGQVQVSEFASYRILIDQPALPAGVAQGLKSRPTWTLFTDPSPANQGELAWRIGLALAAFNFVLMALALSTSNPRANKSGNVLFLLFGFIFYYNLMTMGQRWIGTGEVSALAFMLALHGGVGAACALWLAKRHWGWELNWTRPWWRAAPA